ncbi:cytochrome c/c1 heme lyase-domain-containing protein [Phycomyces blakesleeanus]
MAQETPEKCPVDHTKQVPKVDIADKCPVDHQKLPTQTTQTAETCPVDHHNPHQTSPGHPSLATDSSQECPVDPSAYKHFLPPKEGCDSDAIDSSNYMPAISQQPQKDQSMALGKDREISTIPRAESSEKLWVYPSEQMFFNAMRRKNWNPEEKDMGVVVPMHNAVNEQAWSKILEWENMHKTECNQPKLLKFQGRPKDITPKARIRSWFGLRDPRRPEAVSFYLDVRPAVSPSGVWDRLKWAWQKGSFV